MVKLTTSEGLSEVVDSCGRGPILYQEIRSRVLSLPMITSSKTMIVIEVNSETALVKLILFGTSSRRAHLLSSLFSSEFFPSDSALDPDVLLFFVSPPPPTLF